MDDTDAILDRLAPDLTEQQAARVRELLGDELPSAAALAGLRRLDVGSSRSEQHGHG